MNCFILKHCCQNKRHSWSDTLHRPDQLGCASLRRGPVQSLSSRDSPTSGTSRTEFRSPICYSESSLCISQQDQHLLAGWVYWRKAASLLHDNSNTIVHLVWLNHKHKIAIKCNISINLSSEGYVWNCLYLTLLYKITNSVLSVNPESQCLQNQQVSALEIDASRNSLVALLFVLSMPLCPRLNISHFCNFLYSLWVVY